MTVTARIFLESLATLGILPDAELSALRQPLAEEALDADAELLARDLIRQGKLTKFQASNIYQGRGKGLFFGDYVVLDKLGEGGMGQVFKAQHRRMKRVVALKVLPAHLTSSERNVKRFYQEVEVAAKLTHPNIVTAFDAGESRGLHYLVMEYVEGKDLSAYVARYGPLSVQQAVNCLLQAARGLEYAHSQGIIHRDIKPSNLLLDRQGTIKILDMGLARMERAAAEGAAAKELTENNQMMGTADYVAPEQAVDTRSADFRADIYSLGCTLYRVLVGKPVYSGETSMQKVLGHLNEPIPPLVSDREDIPFALDQLYQRMLAKNPAERIQPMSEVVSVLDRLNSGVDPEKSSVILGDDASEDEMASFLKSIRGSSTDRKSSSTKLRDDATRKEGSQGSVTKSGPFANLPSNPRLIAIGACCLLAVAAMVAYLVFPFNRGNAAPEFVEGANPSEVPAANVVEPETPVATRATPLSPPADFSTHIDLLKLIDPANDAVAGQWKFDNGTLVVPPTLWARLQIPVIPPPEYDVAMTVDPFGGVNGFVFGLVAGRSQTLVNLDGSEGKISGLQMLDGKPADQNESRHEGEVLGAGPNSIVYSVRKDGILVTRDGKPIVRWVGNLGRLSPDPKFVVPKTDQLFVGAYSATCRISRLDLLPPSAVLGELLAAKPEVPAKQVTPPVAKAVVPAKPVPAKPSVPAVPSAAESLVETVDLLKRIDLARDGKGGNWTLEATELSCKGEPSVKSKIVLPFNPPDEYDLKLTCDSRMLANGGIYVNLLVDGRTVMAAFDSHTRCGLGMIDRAEYTNNESSRSSKLISVSKPFTVLCAVRRGRVCAMIDGQPVFDWSGDSERLLPSTLGINVPQLGLTATGNCTFSKIEISPPSSQLPSYSVVDLLAAVDVKRDAVEGEWKRDRQDLIAVQAAPLQVSMLALPVFRPNEYQLTAVVERLDGGGSFFIGLPVSILRGTAVFDGLGRKVTAIHSVSALTLGNGPATVKENCLLLPGHRYSLVCTVKKDAISASCNDRPLYTWNKKMGNLTEYKPYISSDPKAIIIGAEATGWRISKLELRPLDFQKLPVPSAEDRAQLQEVVSKLAGTGNAKNASPDAKLSAAELLLRRAAETLDQPTLRYVLLQESLRLATEAGDLALAMRAADDLASVFDVDQRGIEKQLVADVFKGNRPIGVKQLLVSDSLKWIDRAVAEQRFDLALDLRTAAATLKVGSADQQKELQKDYKTLGFELSLYKTEFDASRSALESLKISPDDADAHVQVGRYHCLVQKDWAAGLEHWAKASGTPWQELARMESAEPTEPDAQVALAERWWELFEKADAPLKWWYLERAAFWYHRATPKAVGKSKTTIEQRRTKLAQERKASGYAFAARHPLDATKIGDRWYKFYPDLTAWRDAVKICERLGGQLACVDTSEEHQAVVQFLRAQPSLVKSSAFYCWLGGSDTEKHGDFRWLDGSPMVRPKFSNWGPSLPVEGDKHAVCYLISTAADGVTKGEWYNALEVKIHFFLCQWDK